MPLQAAGMADTSSTIAGGASGVAIVRRCLDTLGDVLGQPALRVMTQLVMAGERCVALAFSRRFHPFGCSERDLLLI